MFSEVITGLYKENSKYVYPISKDLYRQSDWKTNVVCGRNGLIVSLWHILRKPCYFGQLNKLTTEQKPTDKTDRQTDKKQDMDKIDRRTDTQQASGGKDRWIDNGDTRCINNHTSLKDDIS